MLHVCFDQSVLKYLHNLYIQIPNGVDGTINTAIQIVSGTMVRGKDRFCGRFFSAKITNDETTGKTVCSKI